MTTSDGTSRLSVLLFTDVVGSTGLKSRLGSTAYSRLLGRHDELFTRALRTIPAAQVLNESGDGYFMSFPSAGDAVRFALQFQKAIHDEPWGSHPMGVRIGIHVGELTQIPNASGRPRFIGLAADMASRVTALGDARQVLLTRTAFDEARQVIHEYPIEGVEAPAVGAPALRWVAHGAYLLKGVDEPLEVFEVGGEGIAPLKPPSDTDKARRSVSAEQEETLGWRPAVGLAIPQRVGWILEKKLGEGTFGEVWLARHETLKQHRVFKFCFDLERLRSFKRELTLFRLLRGALGERRDIAAIYDVRLDHPPFFLEGEYAPSGNLADWSADGALAKLPPEARIEIVAKVADAVAAAHSIGVLHKDVKPTNILMYVEPDGTLQPRLTDFGIGILTDPNQLAAHQITEAGFTMLGDNESSRTGTRMYAPPESLSGRPFTTAGDIYALGVLLYQMTIADLSRPLAPGWERDVGDELIREDIGRCVDGDPSRRLTSAAELVQRLRALPRRRADRQRDRDAAAAHERRGRLLRAARLFAIGCALIAVVSAAALFREHTLYHALQVTEEDARRSEHEAQLRVVDNLVLAGDSLVQSKRYAQAANRFDAAWKLAHSLGAPTVRAVNGYLTSIGESPPSLFYRPATTQPADFSPVARARIAPSGDTIVAGDESHHAIVVGMPVPQVIAMLPIRGWGYGVCFTPDGKTCFVGSSGGTLRSWRVGQWDKPLHAADNTTFIAALECSPDGKTLVSAEPSVPRRRTGKLHFWSSDTLTHQNELATDRGVASLAFSPDGKQIAAGDEAGNVLLLDAASGAITSKLTGHDDVVTAVAYTPDGTALVTASLDKTARLLELPGGRQLARFAGHAGALRDICVSHDGKLAATASDDGAIKIWDLAAAKELLTLSGHDQGATSVQFLADDSAVVSGGNNGQLAVWPLKSDCVPRFKLHAGAVAGICIAPDGYSALSAGADRIVRQFDLATGRVLREARTVEPVSSIAMQSDGTRALLGEARGVLEMLALDDFSLSRVQLDDFLPPRRLSDPKAPMTGPSSNVANYSQTIEAVAIAPDGKHAFAGGQDLMFSIFDWPPGARGAASGYSRRAALPVSAACFTIDGKQALFGAGQNLYLLDVATGTTAWKLLDTRLRRFECFAMSPDGTEAASATSDHTVRLWKLDSGANSQTLTGHTGNVTAVAFSPDGKVLISASQDDTVRLWDATDGRALSVFNAHGTGVRVLAVSPDGKVILAGGSDGIIRKWDLSLPQRFHGQLDRFPPAIYTSLDVNPNDPKSLQVLGEWYAFRGRDDWAVKCLEQVRAAGGTVSPLLMARCYWKLNRLADAQREFRAALATKEPPADYLQRCLSATEVKE